MTLMKYDQEKSHLESVEDLVNRNPPHVCRVCGKPLEVKDARPPIPPFIDVPRWCPEHGWIWEQE